LTKPAERIAGENEPISILLLGGNKSNNKPGLAWPGLPSHPHDVRKGYRKTGIFDT
jgi:hypothetical protein